MLVEVDVRIAVLYHARNDWAVCESYSCPDPGQWLYLRTVPPRYKKVWVSTGMIKSLHHGCSKAEHGSSVLRDV